MTVKIAKWTFGKFRFAHHGWNHTDTVNGEFLHAIVFGMFAVIALHAFYPENMGYFQQLLCWPVWFVLLFAYGWEVFQAMTPYEQNQGWGGDGLSGIDCIADTIGILGGLLPFIVLFFGIIVVTALVYLTKGFGMQENEIG